MQPEDDRSLSDEATFAGAAKGRSTAEESLGDSLSPASAQHLGDSGYCAPPVPASLSESGDV